MDNGVKINGATVTWKQLSLMAALISALAGSIGGYYVLGYRVDAAERNANEALRASNEIPVIKKDLEYIRREIDKSTNIQQRTLELMEKAYGLDKHPSVRPF